MTTKRIILFILSIQCYCFLCIASTDTFQDSISGIDQLSMLLDQIKNEKQVSEVSIELNQVLSIYEDCYTTQSPQYAECLMWCAYICAEYGVYLQAKKLLSHSKRLFYNYITQCVLDKVHTVFGCLERKTDGSVSLGICRNG